MSVEFDLNQRPLVVIWETTQACDLACFHCRACAQSKRHLLELTTEEGERLIDETAKLHPPVFIFTGGDPLKRPDIYHLVDYAAEQRLHPAMNPSATPLLNRIAIAGLKKAGLARLALSLDGSAPELHDKFRGVPGSYARTLESIYWANEYRLPVQVNTMVSRRNLHDLENMTDLLKNFRLVLWSIFLPVPTGRGQIEDLLAAVEVEKMFGQLYRWAKEMPFKIKTTDAQHYCRFILQQRCRESASSPFDHVVQGPEHTIPAPLPINDGRGFVFVSHIGEVFPGGFFPTSCGNVREQTLTGIYRNSDVFKSLRDTSNLKGKCGRCEFRELCGGSRARAYAMTGDYFAEDPCCIYQPRARAEEERRGLA